MKHKDVIMKGSKSFSLASLFFSPKQRDASWKLYSWCRYCDDCIDDISDRSQQKVILTKLLERTRTLGSHQFNDFYFSAMSEVVNDFNLPLKYPLDLLGGMEMDVKGRRFSTLMELEEYCYCVAGTVGLMMCHILGVRDDNALKYAIALGNAMQLTNIARDLKEDQLKGRLYLPLDWLREKEVTEVGLFSPENEGVLISFQEMLLRRADELYEEGLSGLQFLSLRSSWAVLIASMIYKDIGRVLRDNPAYSLHHRAIVSGKRKILLVMMSLHKMLPLIFKNLFSDKVRTPQITWSMNS